MFCIRNGKNVFLACKMKEINPLKDVIKQVGIKLLDRPNFLNKIRDI